MSDALSFVFTTIIFLHKFEGSIQFFVFFSNIICCALLIVVFLSLALGWLAFRKDLFSYDVSLG